MDCSELVFLCMVPNVFTSDKDAPYFGEVLVAKIFPWFVVKEVSWGRPTTEKYL